MTKQLFLVLILSLGQFSPIVNLKAHPLANPQLLQINQGVQIIEQQQIYGITPRCAIVLNDLVGQSAPTFAGVITNCFFPMETTHGWHKQKTKLAEPTAWRTEVMLHAAQFSGK